MEKEGSKVIDIQNHLAAKRSSVADENRPTSGEMLRFIGGVVQLEEMELLGIATLLRVPLGTWKKTLAELENVEERELLNNMEFRDIGDIAGDMMDAFLNAKENVRGNILVLLEALTGDAEDERADCNKEGQE